jgi:hypothetical protein
MNWKQLLFLILLASGLDLFLTWIASLIVHTDYVDALILLNVIIAIMVLTVVAAVAFVAASMYVWVKLEDKR